MIEYRDPVTGYLVRRYTEGPERNAKLNRRYTAADIETLKQIHFLVKEKGMTLDGASRQLRADRKPVDSKVKALEVLREIRKSLEAVKNSL